MPREGSQPEEAFPLDGLDPSRVSDETLTALFDTAPTLYNYGATRIMRLSQTLILKGGTGTRTCEAHILKLLADMEEREELKPLKTMPIPKVHRVLNIESEPTFGCTCLILMDFIDGSTVEQRWDKLDQAERIDVVSQVASIITTLQSSTLSPEQQQHPGPVGCEDCVARGFCFTDIGAGPFDSKEDFEAWFNRRLEITQGFHQAPDTVPPFRFDKFVLAHLDIAPRNLILDKHGRVWLVDWGHAGVYPESFEAASLQSRKAEAPEYSNMLFEMLPDMLSKHEGLVQQLRWITYALTTAQFVGRRRMELGLI